MKSLRILFMGCVIYSRITLQHILTIGNKNIEIVGIVTREKSDFNSDFSNLSQIALDNGIPYFYDHGNDQDSMAEWIKHTTPDVIYCFGWPYLLRKEILNISKYGVIGYHPTMLPMNRGRHPVVWTLALGLTKTASTFFFMDEGADSGDILSQVEIDIALDDDAEILYQKLIRESKTQIINFTYDLLGGAVKRIPQDHSRANYWRKRTRKDGEIDWRMSARSIHNLVRSLTWPYPGAHCPYAGRDVKIWKTSVKEPNLNIENMEPGKVLDISDAKITVKCGEGCVRLETHEFGEELKIGDYLW